MNDLAKNLILWVVIAIVLMTVFNNFGPTNSGSQSVNYSDFINEVQQGQVRQVDVAPTISYLLGMDVPRDAEGGVVYEALEDPNWHLTEIKRLMSLSPPTINTPPTIATRNA